LTVNINLNNVQDHEAPTFTCRSNQCKFWILYRNIQFHSS